MNCVPIFIGVNIKFVSFQAIHHWSLLNGFFYTFLVTFFIPDSEETYYIIFLLMILLEINIFKVMVEYIYFFKKKYGSFH